MDKMRILSYAKINLCIDIIKKAPNGYHEMRTVIHEIKDLFDEVEIYETQDNDSLSIVYGKNIDQKKRLVRQKENLAFRAVKLVKQRFSIKKNIRILLKKNIPISSGLGGASSNAATTLKALNQLWDLKLTAQELMNLGAELGMDVPFFILGGTALCTHFGERVEPLKLIKNISFHIVMENKWPIIKIPKSHSKTSYMYSRLNLANCSKHTIKTEKLLMAIDRANPRAIIKNLHNDFETLLPMEKNYHLSGSGPAVFTASPLQT